jgi:hypothetical protein
LNRTLQAVFPGVRIHSDGDQNDFVATDRPEPEFVRPPSVEGFHPAIRYGAESVFNRIVSTPPEDGLVLTDDFNPAEFYDAQNREETRRKSSFQVRTVCWLRFASATTSWLSEMPSKPRWG